MATSKRKWRTSKEVAEELELTDRQVRNLCAEGKLHALRVAGGQWRIYNTEKELKAARRQVSYVLATVALL